MDCVDELITVQCFVSLVQVNKCGVTNRKKKSRLKNVGGKRFGSFGSRPIGKKKRFGSKRTASNSLLNISVMEARCLVDASLLLPLSRLGLLFPFG